ncbi:ADP-heptose:LPS heptosyltransferase [Formosa sp. Hel1_31_208]|uniref:glycosyltransferase family 9 protein n=1 Tax=Formosa sp. Hel1_31_208 TaxID=1798225 RepID=UPI00087D95EE|nr:glycosyltransferase family 9 protein [Formosa sp. Hel1_31_208]SDR75819.1 ADP-heptose:LPS heptosyltransferase [Formosa sp. Hel1_31_208]
MPKPKHILVIRLSAMGDVAMTVPVISAFREQYPEVKLTILTKPFFKPLFRNIPNIQVVEIEIKGRHKGVYGLWKLSRELSLLQFDAIADLHNVLRSTILKFFLFGKEAVQINKGRQEKKALVSGKKFEQLKSTHQRYADVFLRLGYPIDITSVQFPQKENLSSKYLEVIGEEPKKWIGVAPFAAYKGKQYPLDLMTSVIETLSEDFKVLLFGAGDEESKRLQEIATQYENVINLAGVFSLSEELDIISNLDVMLSMDSGNAHLAAMLGIKVISVWGITHPYAGFLPFNHTIDSAIIADKSRYPKIPTSVYGNKHPEGYEKVMNSIPPQQIVSKVISELI